MQLRRKNKVGSEVSTHSLNDIMFFLLLFFLIASTMANPNVVKLLLPKSSTKDQVVSKKPINVSVTKDLQYSIDGKPVPKEQLESRLAAMIGTNKQQSVVLRFDRTLEIQKLVEVMEIGNRLKVKMVLATQKD